MNKLWHRQVFPPVIFSQMYVWGGERLHAPPSPPFPHGIKFLSVECSTRKCPVLTVDTENNSPHLCVYVLYTANNFPFMFS
jgi:hypothetical protein